jgi:membrane protein implicated in regulation of membrane protease activity
MEQLLDIFGIWTWWIIAAVLLVAELLVMSVFLVWFGIAALSVGVLALFADIGWQMELLLFVVLSGIYLLLGRRYMKTRAASETDQPFLNQRAQAYVGQTVILFEAIENGRGKVRFDDAIWQVAGQDAPAGSKVRITGVSGMVLQSEPA